MKSEKRRTKQHTVAYIIYTLDVGHVVNLTLNLTLPHLLLRG